MFFGGIIIRKKQIAGIITCFLLLNIAYSLSIHTKGADIPDVTIETYSSELKDTTHFTTPDFIKENGYRVSWSHSTNQIAFDQLQPDGFYDIYIMDPDGTNETCLTDNPRLPKGHKGCSDWHPSGDYIVFTCQKNRYFGRYIPYLKQALNKLATPGEGVNCDLWIMKSDGSEVWQLTNLPTKQHILDKQAYTATLHPHFSKDGSKLLWSERIDSADNKWGEWTLNIADFAIINEQPHLTNITVYQPGTPPCFYESHGFSPDGNHIIFSGNLKENQDENHLDIYTMNIETEHIQRLTTKGGEWDEHAHYSPDGNSIVWMSSNGFGMNTERNWWDYLKTEYWVMNPDGTNKTQLTFYNEQMKNFQQVICSDFSFNADGTHIATTMVCFNETTTIGGIVILNLTRSSLTRSYTSEFSSSPWNNSMGPFGGDRSSFYIDPHNTDNVFVDSSDNSGVWVSMTAGEPTGNLNDPAWQQTMFDKGFTTITGSFDTTHTYVYSTGTNQKGIFKRLTYSIGEDPRIVEWENIRFADPWKLDVDSNAGLQIITDPYRPERILAWYAIESVEDRELHRHPSLFLSEDFGDSWTTIDLDLNTFPSEIHKDFGIAIVHIAFDPFDDNRFILVPWYEKNSKPTSSLVSYHIQEGWTMLTNELPYLISSFDCSSDLKQIYVVFSHYGPLPDDPFGIATKSSNGYIWKYPNASLINEPTFTLKDVRNFLDIRIHPDNSSILFMSANDAAPESKLTDYEVRGTFKSTDGGTTWKRVLQASNENAAFHKRKSTTFDPFNPNVMYMGLSGFSAIRKSVDGGETWTRKMEGLSGINLFGIALHEETVYAVVQSKLAINDDAMSTANWKTRYITDPNGSDTANLYGGVEIDPFDRTIILLGAGKRGRTGTGPNGGIFRNKNAGDSDCPSTRFCENGWERVVYDSVPNNGKMNPQIMDLFFSETIPGLVFAAAESNKAGGPGGEKGIYVSTNHGMTWKWIYDQRDMFFITQDPYNPNSYYVVGGEKESGGRIVKIEEDSSDPTDFRIIDSGDIPLITNNDYLYSISIQKGLNESDAYVFFGSSKGMIYRLLLSDLKQYDFSKAELVYELGPSDYISAVVAIHPNYPHLIYVGGRGFNRGVTREKQGIHRSTDAGETWHGYSQGLDSSELDIFELKISPDGKRMFAGTLSSIAVLDLDDIGDVEIINVYSTFGRIQATIKTGDDPAKCQIFMNGLLWLGGTISVELPAQVTKTIQTPLTFGFGTVDITVSANDVTKKYSAVLIGSLFLNLETDMI